MANPWVARKECFKISLKSWGGEWGARKSCVLSRLCTQIRLSRGRLGICPGSHRASCFLCFWKGCDVLVCVFIWGEGEKGKGCLAGRFASWDFMHAAFASWSGIGRFLGQPASYVQSVLFPVLVQAPLISYWDYANGLLQLLLSPVSLDSPATWGHLQYYTASPLEYTLPCPSHLSLATARISLLHHKASWTSSLFSLVPLFTFCSLTCPYCITEPSLVKVTNKFYVAKSNGSNSLLIELDPLGVFGTVDYFLLLEALFFLDFNDDIPSWFSSISLASYSQSPWPAPPPSWLLHVGVPQGLVLKQLIQSQSSKDHLKTDDSQFYISIPEPRLIHPPDTSN